MGLLFKSELCLLISILFFSKIMPEKIVIESDFTAVGKHLAMMLEKLANETLETEEFFKIGLSGSSMVQLLAECLPDVKTDWTRWRFFFCDERVVGFDSKDSTYGQYKAELIGKIPITEDQFIKIDPELSADEAAKDYIKKMSVYFAPDSFPRFDTLLLGIGPDGHTCSLFPNHKLLNETSLWVGPITDSPKPPPSRITLTFPVINNAKAVIFIATGGSKKDILERIIKKKENLPATRVQPTNGDLFWLLDKEAARNL